MTPKSSQPSSSLASASALPLARALRAGRSFTVGFTAGLLLLDSLVAAVAYLAAFSLRQGEPASLHALMTWWSGVASPSSPYLILLPLVVAIRLVTFQWYGLYRLSGDFHPVEDLATLFKAVSLGSVYVIVAVFLFRGGVAYRNFSYSRLVFLYDWGLALGGFTVMRLLVRRVQWEARLRGRNLIPALVVGTGQEAKVCIAEICESPRLGYNVLGALTTDETTPEEAEAGAVEGVPIVGAFADLPVLARQFGVTEALITDSRLPSRDIFHAMMRSGRKNHLSFRVVPSLFNCLPQKTEIHQVGSLPMIKLFEDPLSGPSRFLKRALDVVGAAFGLLLLTPLFAVVAYLIKRESPGPVFYAQERVGMDGRPFKMYKFRSMRADADDEIHRRLMRETIASPERTNQGTTSKPIYGKILNDPRLTKVGAAIRRYSIDELPNLWNVLRGDMSLVGPRSPIPYEVENYQEWHRARFYVKGGVTGLWQVSGRNRLNFEQMVQLDVHYIENWSLWLDIKILLKTIPVVLRGDNAY